MKKVICLSYFLVAIAFSTDFKASDFYEQTQRPELENVEEKFLALKNSLNGVELSDAQKNKLQELEKSFQTIVTPPKYRVAWSQGPDFRAAAIEQRQAEIEEGDWQESMSYLHESWDEISAYCGAADYSDPDIDIEFYDVVRLESEEPVFVWNSIKEAANQPSKAYILYTAIKLEVKEDPAARGWKKCLFPYSYNIVEKDLDAESRPVLQESLEPDNLRELFKGAPRE